MFGRFALLLCSVALACASCGPLTAIGISSFSGSDDDDDGGSKAPLDDLTVSAPFPADGAIQVPVSLRMSWQASTQVSRFEVFLGDEELPETPTLTTTERFADITRLDFDRTYFWRVDALDSEERRFPGSVTSFKTIVEAAPQFQLSSEPVLRVFAGETLKLDVTILDEGDLVTLSAKQLPIGAEWIDTVEPTLAPLDSTMLWTPTEAQRGLSIVTLISRDAGGSESSIQLFLQVVDPWPSPLQLSSLDGENGIQLLPLKDSEQAGYSVSGIGDVNQDGYADIVIGIPNAQVQDESRGRAIVVYGGPDGSTAGEVSLELLGDRATLINGRMDGDQLGKAVHGVGDVNGDGIADFAVGAPTSERGAGALYVIFGGETIVPGVWFNLESLDGENGVAIFGINADDSFGSSVSGLSDINGDGFDDLIAGAPNADPGGLNRAGTAYVLFGGREFGKDGSLNLANLVDEDGFAIPGIETQAQFGHSVMSSGDVDRDGFRDILIGAPFASPGGINFAGEVFLVLSSADIGKSGSLDLLAPRDAHVVRLSGATLNGLTGSSLGSLGDLNSDDFDDFILGSPGQGNESSLINVLYGGESWRSRTSIALDQIPNGEGWTAQSDTPGIRVGFSVAGMGDANGDGKPDMIIGSPGRIGGPDGAWALYGNVDPPGVDLNGLDGTLGISLDDGGVTESLGWSASGAGDFNGDGLNDLLMGSTNDQFDDGRAHLVFGRPGGYLAEASTLHRSGPTGLRGLGENSDGSSPEDPIAHVFIAFDEGREPSSTRALAISSRDGLFKLPDGLRRRQVASMYWEISTDRTGWNEATIVFRPSATALKGIHSSQLRVFRAPSIAGPWKQVRIDELDLDRRRVRVKTPRLGVFILTE